MASDDEDIPETGAIFTFGKTKFAENLANKFWIRDDKILQVACGDEHSAVITSKGRLFTFGCNNWGQLGHGNNKPYTRPTTVKKFKGDLVKSVACGRSHTLVVSEAGVFSFGDGADGQLGHGDCENYNLPTQIQDFNDKLVTQISCGAEHSAAITDDGELYVWGSGSEGQLGIGVDECERPVLLKFKSKIRVVSCGYYHTAFVTVDGRLFTFGDNDHGKLGLEADQCHSTAEPQHVKTVTNAVVCVSCGANHTAVINDCGALLTFGSGKYGQLGHGPSYDDVVLPKQVTLRQGEFFTFVTCGADHTAVLTKNGKLFTFGDGRHGKLAMGDDCFSNLFQPTRVSRLKDFYVEQVSCGGCHMLAVAVRNKGDNVGDDQDISVTQEDNYGEDVPDGPRLSHTIPAHGMSARDKRRIKELEHDTTNIKKSLPPLHRSLPPLAATIGITSKKNQDLLDNNNEKTITSLDKSTLPVITNKRDHDDITKQRRPLPRPRRTPRKNGTESDEEVKHDKPIPSELSPRPKPTPRKRKTVKKDKRNEEMTRNNDGRKGDDDEEESVDESDDAQRINGDRNDAERISGDRNNDGDDKSGGDELAENGLKIVKVKDDSSGVHEDGNMVTEIRKGLLGITEDETGISNDRKEGNESDYDESEEDESKDGSEEQDDDEQETRSVKSKDEVSYDVKEKIVEKNGNNKKLDKQNGAVDEENEQNSKKMNKEKDPEKEDSTKQENIAEASKKDEDDKENINKNDSNNNEDDMKKITEGKNQKVNTKTKKSGVCNVL